MPAVGKTSHVLGFACVRCGKERGLGAPGYVCPCGGNLQLVYDYKSLARRVTRRTLAKDPERSIWRYAELLPASSARHRPRQQIGWTPLYKAGRLGRELGLSRLYLKDDGRNPSASFKDRAGAVAIVRAREIGRRIVAGASTGNAASSLACLAPGTGVVPVVFVPETAPEAKVAQLLVFGAAVFSVAGTYDDAFDLCLAACAEFGWYNRNTGYNAFTREGKKTAAYELVEQLDWKVPDLVFVPTGDGNILSGVWKGFKDFYALGLISRLPRLVCVQAEHSDAVKRAFEGSGKLRPVSGKTLADSISVSLPRDGEAALKALRESKGFAVSVSDKEILAAIADTARLEGVFVEPAAAAAVAGLRKAVRAGKVASGALAAVLLTGNGLKDVASARKAAGKPCKVRPSLSDLKRRMKGLRLGDNG